jgi:hypothetical protein
MLQLLKASISSTNVLNDVFGKYCADVQCAPSKLSSHAVTDKFHLATIEVFECHSDVTQSMF